MTTIRETPVECRCTATPPSVRHARPNSSLCGARVHTIELMFGPSTRWMRANTLVTNRLRPSSTSVTRGRMPRSSEQKHGGSSTAASTAHSRSACNQPRASMTQKKTWFVLRLPGGRRAEVLSGRQLRFRGVQPLLGDSRVLEVGGCPGGRLRRSGSGFNGRADFTPGEFLIGCATRRVQRPHAFSVDQLDSRRLQYDQVVLPSGLAGVGCVDPRKQDDRGTPAADRLAELG